MEKQAVQQMQGAVELMRDAVQVGAGSIGAAHQELAGIPYRVLQHVPLLSRPAGVVERMQRDITQLAYSTVRAIAGVVAAAATRSLNAVAAEQQGDEAAQG